MSKSNDFKIADDIAISVIESVPAAILAIEQLIDTMEAVPVVDSQEIQSVKVVGADLQKLLASVEMSSLESLPESGLAALEESSNLVFEDLPPALAAIDGLIQSLETMPEANQTVLSVESMHLKATSILKTLEQ